MKFVFISNYLSHHQLPFCQQMYQRLGDGFHFIATAEILPERLALGYPDLNNAYPFVVRTYEGQEQTDRAMALALDADVAVIGSAPKSFVKGRLKEKKLTFAYSERLYKKGFPWWKLPLYLPRFYRTYGQYKSFYLLCASAYTAGDFAKTGTFLNKTYKWGYFPETKDCGEPAQLVEQKNPASILWAGRFIDWKHPESVISVARRLKEDGYDFQIHMIGNGALLEAIGETVQSNGLEAHVKLLGSMSPEEVRGHMERTEIYLFTSDRNEGWGAVLNESMNSGCAVVASDAIGSVPFLIHDGENGLIYKSGDEDELYKQVKFLMDNPDQRRSMGEKAYETMTRLWNAEEATERLLALCQALLEGQRHPQLYTNGPCSKAIILKNKHA